jgi:hypothetical protein
VKCAITRLLEAGELSTAERVARRAGMTVRELLYYYPPRHPRAHVIVDLYVALAERHNPGRIAALVGRDRTGVYHALQYRLDPEYRERCKAKRRSAYHERRFAYDLRALIASLVEPMTQTLAARALAARAAETERRFDGTG